MIKLDENLLVELGLQGMPKEEKAAFLKHMYETLEMRVGTRLAERMSDQQMAEFEQFINANDEQGAFHWLETNFPNYKDVVAEEFEKLKAEIKPMAPHILAASQQQQAAQPAEAAASPAMAPAPHPQQPQHPQQAQYQPHHQPQYPQPPSEQPYAQPHQPPMPPQPPQQQHQPQYPPQPPAAPQE